jgi:flagellar basal body P-ring formation protein FlgA
MMLLVGAVCSLAVVAPVALDAQAAGGEQRAARSDSVSTCFVAARPLARGITLADGDVKVVPECDQPSHLASRTSPLGSITRRVIAEGEPLHAPAIAPAPLVTAGQQVELLWTSGGIHLTLHGTALARARHGDQVWVRLDARRRILGIAIAPGMVQALSSRNPS